MAVAKNTTEYLVGINLNTMTSTALTSYSKKLAQDITALQAEESSGSMSKARKNLLKQKLQAQRAVTHQSKRLMSFFNELKKAGFDFGSVKEFSVESLADSAMKSTQNASNEQKGLITGIVEKYKNKQTTIMGMDTGVGSLLVGGTKVAGIALLGIPATTLAFTTAQAIGKIPVHDSTLYSVVGDWLKKFFPGLKGMAITAAIGGIMLIAAKKFQQHMNNKDMTVSEAMAEQIADEDEKVKNHMKENEGVTLETQVSRAETDPSYLQTLVNMVNGSGKSVNQIIVDGPVKCGAELYNAARIIKRVQEKANVQAQSAQKDLNQEKREQYTTDLAAAEKDVQKASSKKDAALKKKDNANKALADAKAERDKIFPDEAMRTESESVYNKVNDLIRDVQRLSVDATIYVSVNKDKLKDGIATITTEIARTTDLTKLAILSDLQTKFIEYKTIMDDAVAYSQYAGYQKYLEADKDVQEKQNAVTAAEKEYKTADNNHAKATKKAQEIQDLLNKLNGPAGKVM